MKKFTTYFLMTLCFWALVFIGPVIILLWNNISYYVSGLGYGSNSLMYKILVFVSQPISCMLAAGAANAAGKGKHNICTLINCVVCACLCTVFAVVESATGDYLHMYAMIVSIIVCIWLCWELAKSDQKEAQAETAKDESDPNYGKRKELRQKIEKLKFEKAESEKTYRENRKIYEEAYSDEDLRQMVKNGEFTEGDAESYINNRNGLEMYLSFYPKGQATISNFIDSLEKELEELEPTNNVKAGSQTRKGPSPYRSVFLTLIALIILMLIVITILCAASIGEKEMASRQVKDTQIIATEPIATTLTPTEIKPELDLKTQDPPKNGAITIGSQYKNFPHSEITIHTDKTPCVVKLKDYDRHTVVCFYVKSNSTATVAVPTETLYVYFAQGSKWYGWSDLFGGETTYSMDPEPVDFSTYTFEYTLYEVENGNLSLSEVDPDDF